MTTYEPPEKGPVRMARRTEGLSPKAPTAGVGAILAPLVARLIAEVFDIDVDSEAVEAVILLLLAGIGGVAGAYAGKPGKVEVEHTAPNRID